MVLLIASAADIFFILVLQAETLEDLHEWKTALENALAQAPSHAMGQNGIFRNDQIDSVDGSLDHCMFTRNV